jgi:alpha-mannosidase
VLPYHRVQRFMDRRSFLRNASILAAGWEVRRGLYDTARPTRLTAAEESQQQENPNWPNWPNWIDPQFQTTVKASSYYADPPWGYVPSNIFGNNLFMGWEADNQTDGAWLEVDFHDEHSVGEIWILTQPLAHHILGQDVYMMTYSRTKLYAPPRRIQCTLSSGLTLTASLRQAGYFQILTFSQAQKTASLRARVEDVWSRPGTKETGIAKLRAFPRPHPRSFEIDAYSMYDIHDGKPVQTATLHLINPGEEVTGARLTISHNGTALMQVPLAPIAGRAVTRQEVWIPTPFQPEVMDFAIEEGGAAFGSRRSLRIPPYHSYFDRGVFALNCTCHNDLGWLNTQEKTADYRSAEIILPAMKLLDEYPEFRYSMETTAYLMEFLDRHPERRQEMVSFMEEERFMWGASYVENQEVHVGPEKLVRQFYFGKRWLEKTFPGVHTRFYVKTDPPSMTLQMPQILARAGVTYHIQGRMPYGFYRWEAPDGSFVLTYAYHYVDPMRLLDPKGDHGWLSYATEREYYYAPHHLPPMFIYDYTSDYLPPQPALPPYTRQQNAAMKRFAGNWNQQHPAEPIHPPKMVFVTPEGFLDQFTQHPLDITTLKGDWPFSWAYYDEPSNREGLLAGREAHNRLLIAERIFAGLSLEEGFPDYPRQTFTEAWRANCWPDHGWGGNRGIVTDSVYVASYEKSKKLADELLSTAGQRLVKSVKPAAETQAPLVVFNPLTWERTGVVQCQFLKPSGWGGIAIRDERGKEIPVEISGGESEGSPVQVVFIAETVPSLGYRAYSLEPASSPSPAKSLSGWIAENQFFKMVFGDGGIKSLYDKRLRWETLRTEKFDGAEVLQFTAPGSAWEDPEIVTMKNFDKTSNHPFPFKSFVEGPVRTTAVREASFRHFSLRERFHLYHKLDQVEIELEVLDWDGQKERELRVVCPVNLDGARMTYEVPFGKVEIGKDELNFSLLPPDPDTAFRPDIYGGDHPLAYREAINWIDASSPDYLMRGLLSASDTTVHLFRDESPHPLSYPLLQHVLLSTRKSLAWNPEYWFTQKGSHHYRISLLPHKGDWRLRYREALDFNYPLVAFSGSHSESGQPAARSQSFLRLHPANLALTALKRSEDDDRLVIRFYEAEGFETPAQIRFAKPISRAWRASLIEYDEEPLRPAADGSLQFSVKPWEIVTVKLAF